MRRIVWIALVALAALTDATFAGVPGGQGLSRAAGARAGSRAASSTTRTVDNTPLTAGDAATLGSSVSGPGNTEPPLPPAPEPTPLAPVQGPSAPVLYRIPTSAPVVFVTIDDGWVRDPRVVTFLNGTHWPVSLFLIERAALADLGYFRALQSAGAAIEDHTVDHPRLPQLPYAAQVQEICRPAQDYQTLFGTAPTLFRPPYGALNGLTRQAARACGETAVMEWTATLSGGHLEVVGGSLLRGDIILLHFRPTLYGDLLLLQRILASDHLTVARLEDYLPPPALAAPPGSSGPTGPSQPTSSSPRPSTTTAPAPTTTTTTTSATSSTTAPSSPPGSSGTTTTPAPPASTTTTAGPGP